MNTHTDRLEYLRQELRAERISQDELIELHSLVEHIEPGDVELLEAAGVPEFAEPVTEATVTLSLSEYEASIITGALVEFGERWGEGEQHTATYLRERVQTQLPEEWAR